MPTLSGVARSVPVVAGKSGDPRDFCTFAPMVLARSRPVLVRAGVNAGSGREQQGRKPLHDHPGQPV